MTNKTYDVGYCNPPQHSRFQKGKSGNPSGRPKHSRNTYKLLEDILEQKVSIVQDGKQIKISKKVAILLQAVNSAVKGDTKAIRDLFPHLLAVDAKQEEKEQKRASLKADDLSIINNFLQNKEAKNGEL